MNLDKVFACPIRRKIVLFFHNNPSSIDTARGIATWINSTNKEAQDALEQLVSYNILLAHRASSTTGYAYTQERHIISAIDSYIKTHNIFT